MSEELAKEPKKSAKPKTTTFETPLSFVQRFDASQLNVSKQRFTPSGLRHDDYIGTRIRRFESYQQRTVVSGLAAVGIRSLGDLDDIAEDPRKVEACACYLQCCLVTPEGRDKVAHLFRKGNAGLKRMKRDLKAREIAAVMKRVAEFCEFY